MRDNVRKSAPYGILRGRVVAMVGDGVNDAPALAGLLNPLIAAGAMLASSLSVVGNSLRLREGSGNVGKKLVEFFLPWVEPSG